MNVRSAYLCTSLAIGLLLSAIPTKSQAQAITDTWYVGAGWSQVDFDDEDVQLGVLMGLAGYNLSPNFALEGRFGTGISSDSLVVLGVRADIDIKNYYGLFVRGTLPVSDTVNLYALAGYGTVDVEVSAAGFGSASEDEDSEAFGAGIEFVWGAERRQGLAVEWARYFEDSSTLSAIYRYRF